MSRQSNNSVLPDSLRNLPVKWGPIGEDVFYRTYSHKKDDGTNESWAECVTRTVSGNLALVDKRHIEPDEQEKLVSLFYQMGALPAGRHLSASGRPGRQFLFNCLSGQTKVLTKKGWLPISECAQIGKIEVLAQGSKEQTGVGCWTYGQGEWRSAEFRYFGEQDLYVVKFSDGTEVMATAEHKWYVTKRANPVETKNLVGHNVPFVTAPKPEKGEVFQAAILHGFTFGDGNLNVYKGKPHSAHVRMFAEKDNDIAALFQAAGFEVTHPEHCNAYVGKLPADWKFLPSEDASREYWYGFIVGLIAADGTVSDQSGSVILYQSDKEALDLIRQKSMEVGFACTPISMQREKNPWTGEISPNWRFTLRRFSVQPKELVLSQHRTNFEQAGDPSSGRSLEVLSVTEAGKKEAVYCAIEPETHTFVIENSLLTGNCHAAGWSVEEPSAHVSFLFDELMQGGGVGSNYSNRFIRDLPKVTRQIDLHIICREDHPNVGELESYVSAHCGKETDNVITVQDSREGWVEATDALVRVAFGESAGFDIADDATEATITLDLSLIRERNAPLKTSGGKACGPKPLAEMLVNLVRVLDGCYGRQLTSLDWMQVDHACAACVIAGGKRRSSRMSVKNWADDDIYEFINCKSMDGSHWSTNISVEIDNTFIAAYHDADHHLHTHARRVMRAVILGKRSNGEPGFWNVDMARIGEREPEKMFCPNPCGEIGLQMWENCNLGHINLEHWAPNPSGGVPAVEMQEAFRLMARFLVRATFGDIPQARQREVVDRNRRIGVGFFGYHAWLALHGIRYSDGHKDGWICATLGAMHEVVKEAAHLYATQLGIPSPVKFTTLAPTGTIAILPGATASGQAMFGPWFKRRVRYSNMDDKLQVLRMEGYEMYPDDDAADTTIVVYYCEDPLTAKVRALGFDPASILESQYDIKLEDSLATQAMFQSVYVDNAISFTINMFPQDMPNESEMEAMFVSYLPLIKGTTFFPEKSRKNSPYEVLSKEQWDAYTGPKQVTSIEVECKTGCPVK